MQPGRGRRRHTYTSASAASAPPRRCRAPTRRAPPPWCGLKRPAIAEICGPRRRAAQRPRGWRGRGAAPPPRRTSNAPCVCGGNKDVRPDALANNSVPWPLKLWLHIATHRFGTHTAHADGKQHTVYEIRVVNSDNAIHLCSRRFQTLWRRCCRRPASRRVAASVSAGRRRRRRRRRALDEYVSRPRRVAAERAGRGRGRGARLLGVRAAPRRRPCRTRTCSSARSRRRNSTTRS